MSNIQTATEFSSKIDGCFKNSNLFTFLQLSLAAKCYARCLQIDDQNGGGWQDLGLTYYFLAEASTSKDGEFGRGRLERLS